MDKFTYLLRVFVDDKLLYHKTLRFIAQINNKFIFSDLTVKGNVVEIDIDNFPEYFWVEEDKIHKQIVTFG